MVSNLAIFGAVATICMVMATQPAGAQSASSNAAAGRKLADQFCSQCHVVAPHGKAGWTNAPTFEAIANRQGTTAPKLSAIIQKPHLHMLNVERPQNESDELAAYIMTLRKS